jgi:methylenetetrahydrofolate reductase (NADPH)
MARRRTLDGAALAALARVLEAPTFEVIPLRNALDQAAFLPSGATVSVTASPTKAIEATVELSAELEARGLRAIPHLSARMIRDRAHLAELLRRLDDVGIDRAFVVGGDAEAPGDYPDGLSLLRAMAELDHRVTDIGIPCYPQGHPSIPDDRLLEALAAKAPFARSMTTQMCFDSEAIGTWLAARRADGIGLPAVIGIPGVADPQRLMTIGARIGVKDTRRFVLKNVRFVTKMLRSGGFYRPDDLILELAPLFADPIADVGGIHLYTFNGVEATEGWRTGFLEGLATRASA